MHANIMEHSLGKYQSTIIVDAFMAFAFFLLN